MGRTKKVRQFELTYRKSENRWQKFYQGEYHYFPVPRGLTKEQSYEIALKNWKIKLGKMLEGVSVIKQERYGRGTEVEQSIKDWQEMRDAAIFAKDFQAAKSFQSHIDALRLLPSNAKVDKWEARPLYGYPETTRAIWHDRKEIAKKYKEEEKGNLTLKEIIKLYLEYKEKIKIEESTHKGLITLFSHLKQWEDFNPSQINNDFINDFYIFLKNNFNKESYRRRLWVNLKALLHWADEEGHLVKPTLLGSRRFTFEIESGKKETVPKDIILSIYNTAPDNIKLYLLLGLNCAYTAKDIVSITQEQIDWENKTLSRKRSKMKKKERFLKYAINSGMILSS